MRVVGLDHVQLAMPRGREAEARAFYGDVLGLGEVAKPPQLAPRGGLWFSIGALQLHLGVEEDFRPARQAHPALLVDGLPEMRQRLTAAGLEPRDDDPVDGRSRLFVADPFGNRLELIAAGPLSRDPAS